MGILDSVSNAANRGVAAAGRTSRSVRLKMQADDLLKQRKDYAAQLGASLYEKTKDMSEMREGREPLYSAIEDIDRQRQVIADELEAIEAAAQESEQAAQTYECSKCGNTVSAADLYCSGCGRAVAEIKEEAEALGVIQAGSMKDMFEWRNACPECGSPVAVDDVYCMSCGAELEVVAQRVVDASEEACDTEIAGGRESKDTAADIATIDESAESESAALQEPSEEGAVVERIGESEVSPKFLCDDAPFAPIAFCMQCGKPVAPDDVFCGGCGCKL